MHDMWRWPIIFCLSFLMSCAGYKAVDRGNPLSQYGIKTVSVPMFLNQSTLAAVSGKFTSEFINLMSSYPGLVVETGFNNNSDAVLIGVVESNKYYAQTVTNAQQRVASSAAQNNVGSNRNDFYIPATTNVNLRVRLMLLKKPTEEELALLRSKYASKLRGNTKIIFNEVISVSETFNREVFDKEEGQINFTQNYGILNKSIEKMARKAAMNFEESVLYAF